MTNSYTRFIVDIHIITYACHIYIRVHNILRLNADVEINVSVPE